MAVLNRVLYARNERPEQVGRAKFLVAAAGKLRQPGSPRQIITPICGTTGEYFGQHLISWARDKVAAEHPCAPGQLMPRPDGRVFAADGGQHHEFA